MVKLVSRMQLPVREELQLCKDEAQTRDTLLFRLRVLGVLHGKGEVGDRGWWGIRTRVCSWGDGEGVGGVGLGCLCGVGFLGGEEV